MGENTLLLNACLAMLTIWLCRMEVHFGFLRKCWNKGCFKNKKGNFLFSQLKTLHTAEFKRTNKCFILTETVKSVIAIYDQTLINQFLQKCSSKIISGLGIMAANKMLNFDLKSFQSKLSL